MNRREFIKTSLWMSASAALWPKKGFSLAVKDPFSFQQLNHFSLTDFADAQEEGPVLFGNRRQSWLVSLRRMFYPQDQEMISLFQLQDGKWQETSPVTSTPGQCEAVTADCSPDGEPLVAWTELRGQQWLIQAAVWKDGAFQPPVTLNHPNQRAINPVAKSAGAEGHIVAWEQFAGGKFTIWLARCQNGTWSQPLEITHGKESCFEPALEVASSGEIYLAYTCTDGPHRNIHMVILDSKTLKPGAPVPVAIGGGLEGRVNINAHARLAFDEQSRLWISWENNRFANRFEDSDCYTGDRACAMVCYFKGQICELSTIGRWLFKGENDHLPTFFKDPQGHLYVLTHSGGIAHGSKELYTFRVSHLDPALGWAPPVTLLQTKQKGELLRPSIVFAQDGQSFWFIWKNDQSKNYEDAAAAEAAGAVHTRRGRLEMEQFSAPILMANTKLWELIPAVVMEYHPVKDFRPLISGRQRQPRPTITYKGETYTMLRGNLHEHTENSVCWPAGTDGTLHEDLRYGLFGEAYDFVGITDHTYSLTEVYWRKTFRMLEFYNDSPYFIALPAAEWTLSNDGNPVIGHGVGHRNIFFSDVSEAKKFIRNKDEVYSEMDPETRISPNLWEFIRTHKIDCISIPHHPADSVHALDWDVRDEDIEPVVEIFQCRGNAEYRGAPRMINVSRHHPMPDNDKGFIDYALREKKYRLGFVASGDHNSMGVGVACVWVKEISRRGILEALRARRCFATTGDQIVVDFRVNDAICGETVAAGSAVNMTYKVDAIDDITRVEILRNSRVVHVHEPASASRRVVGEWTDPNPNHDEGVLYYYARVTQKNNHLAWSSPIWIST